jgi:hypothetical protein
MRLVAGGGGGGQGGEEAESPTCESCGQAAHFPLRAGGGFGWASKEDALLMRRGMAVAKPQLGLRA